MQIRVLIVIMVLLAACLPLSRCGKVPHPDGMPALSPCYITVAQEGKPLKGVIVRLVPEDGSPRWTIDGWTDKRGVATIKTHAKYPGAPEGTYKVLVSQPERPPYVQPEYEDAKTTPHSITIAKGTNKQKFEVGEPMRVKPTMQAHSHGDAARILNEARTAWDSYLQQIKSCDLECTISVKSKEQSNQDFTIRIISEAPFFVAEMKMNAPAANVEMAIGYNRKYTFALAKAPGGWQIREIAPHSVPPATEFVFSELSNSNNNGIHSIANVAVVAMVAGLNLTIFDSLPVLSSKPEFKILDVKKETLDGERIVRIVYSYEPQGQSFNQLARSGEVSLMPDKYWMIKSAKIQCIGEPGKKAPVMSVTNEYDTNDAGMPLIKKHSATVSGGALGGVLNDLSINVDFVYYHLPAQDLSKKRLTVSHYGLREPSFGGGHAVRYLLPAVSVGIVVGGVIFVLWRRSQRH